MNKNVIRLNESQLREIVKESIISIISEGGMLGNNGSIGGVLGKANASRNNKRDIGDLDGALHRGAKKLASKLPKKMGDKINKSLPKYKSSDDINSQLKRMNKNYGNRKMSQKDVDDYEENKTHC